MHIRKTLVGKVMVACACLVALCAMCVPAMPAYADVEDAFSQQGGPAAHPSDGSTGDAEDAEEGLAGSTDVDGFGPKAGKDGSGPTEMDSDAVVYAAAEQPDIVGNLKTALEGGSDFTLGQDIAIPDGTSWISVTGNVTLDLGGKVITNQSQNSLFVIGSGVTMVVKNGTIQGSPSREVFEVNAGGTLTVQDVVFSGNAHQVVQVNGQTGAATKVTLDKATFADNTSWAIHVNGSSEIAVSNCRFSGNHGESGGAVYADGGAGLSIKSSTFEGNEAAGQGGALFLKGATATFSGSVTLEGNRADGNGGAIQVEDATIDLPAGLVIKNNTAGTAENPANGGGIHTWNAMVNLAGAEVSGNAATNSAWGQGGGGVAVNGNSTLNMSSGTVKGNFSAGGGGGILLIGGSMFNMTGGFISDNIAQLHEGGGLSVMSGSAKISAGYVTGNKSGYNRDGSPNPAYQDWGGGGIFVSDQGDPTASLAISAVTVRGNEAGGFGGGVAGCATGRLFIFGAEGTGAAIYGNTAAGQRVSGDGSVKHEDHTYAQENTVFMESGYADYFCARSSVIDNRMYGGGFHNWTGSIDGEHVAADANVDELLTSTYCMGMTAHPSTVPTDAPVVISGNSSYTHGGGILCNGYLVVGSVGADDTLIIGKSLEVTMTKALMGVNGEKASLAGHEFTFSVKNGKGDAADVVATGKSDEEGAIRMDNRLAFGPKNCTDAVKLSAPNAGADASYQLTYYITENDPSQANVRKDASVYRLTVTVDRVLGSQTISGVAFSKMNYVIADAVLHKQEQGKGAWAEVEAALTRTDEAHADALATGSESPSFTNLATITVTGAKVWDDGDDADGIRPTTITVVLLSNGRAIASKDVSAGVDGSWKFAFDDLLAYDDEGNPVKYTVQELAVEGYDSDVTGNAESGFTITNTHAPTAKPVRPVSTSTSGKAIPRAGDDAPWRPLVVLTVLSLATVAVAVRRFRRA